MLEEKAAGITLLFLDVDGVLTDGSITISELGEESKSFNVKDGLGLKMLMSSGVDVILISGRRSKAVSLRARELGIGGVYQGVKDKAALCKRLLKEKGLDRSQACAMGDDLPDLAMFREAALALTVADAVKEVREAADFVTPSAGGFGAVREACEWLLHLRGAWDEGTSGVF